MARRKKRDSNLGCLFKLLFWPFYLLHITYKAADESYKAKRKKCKRVRGFNGKMRYRF